MSLNVDLNITEQTLNRDILSISQYCWFSMVQSSEEPLLEFGPPITAFTPWYRDLYNITIPFFGKYILIGQTV